MRDRYGAEPAVRTGHAGRSTQRDAVRAGDP